MPVQESVVSGETYYQSITEAALIRKRSFELGYRLTGAARWAEGNPNTRRSP